MIRIFARKFRNQFFVNIFEDRKLIGHLTWDESDYRQRLVFGGLLTKIAEYTDIKYIDPKQLRESFDRLEAYRRENLQILIEDEQNRLNERI